MCLTLISCSWFLNSNCHETIRLTKKPRSWRIFTPNFICRRVKCHSLGLQVIGKDKKIIRMSHLGSITSRIQTSLSFWISAAGSQHTRSHPWQGREEKTWQARQIRTSGISKSCPDAHLKDDLCLSDACYIRLLPNFCDTGKRPSPISLQTEST